MAFLSTFLLGTALTMSEPVAPPSDPVEPAYEWQMERFSMSMDTRGSADDDYSYSGVRISTTDTSKKQITLGCSKRTGITATLFLTPRDELTEAQINRRRLKYTSVREQVRVGDGRRETMPFTRVSVKNVLQSIKRKTGARIFNAIASGEDFSVGKSVFDPPAVDDEFRAFASACKAIRDAD